MRVLSTLVAQDLRRHGVVTAVDGQEVTIHLSEGLSVDIGTAGTIYTTTTVGREEKSVRIAKVEVTGATRRTVTVRVTEQTQVPETGFSVSFKTVERPATLRLDDTLHVTVRATSAVRELRVQQDNDLRRPYWMEEGDALVFPFTQRLVLQDQLDSLQLLPEGYPYPKTRTDGEGRIIVTFGTSLWSAEMRFSSARTDSGSMLLKRQ